MASPPFLLLLTSLCTVTAAAAAAAATYTLSQGESISGAATLVSSPSGVFELGFFSPDPKNSSRLYLGIWYRDISPRTVVWVANREAPATGPSPSLTLTASGDLSVLDGSRVLWSTNMSAPRGNYSAKVFDSGNLVVSAGDGVGGGQDDVVWESFEHPGDTMLSNMRISVRTPRSRERMLFTSWSAEGDPAPGRYALGLDPAGSGQAYIWRDGTVPIWRSGQWTGQNFVGIPWRPLYVYGFKQANDPNLGVYYTYTAPNTTLQRFVVMPNGTDVCYMVKNSAKEWETVWMQPLNECEYYATCGANAMCTTGEDGKATCSCLKGLP